MENTTYEITVNWNIRRFEKVNIYKSLDILIDVKLDFLPT